MPPATRRTTDSITSAPSVGKWSSSRWTPTRPRGGVRSIDLPAPSTVPPSSLGSPDGPRRMAPTEPTADSRQHQGLYGRWRGQSDWQMSETLPTVRVESARRGVPVGLAETWLDRLEADDGNQGVTDRNDLKDDELFKDRRDEVDAPMLRLFTEYGRRFPVPVVIALCANLVSPIMGLAPAYLLAVAMTRCSPTTGRDSGGRCCPTSSSRAHPRTSWSSRRRSGRTHTSSSRNSKTGTPPRSVSAATGSPAGSATESPSRGPS